MRLVGIAPTPFGVLRPRPLQTTMVWVMTAESMPEEESAPGAAREGATGRGARRLAWVTGLLLGVIGAAAAIRDTLRQEHNVAPYLVAAGFLLCLLAALDMWRVERLRARRATRSLRRVAARVERLEDARRHLELDRDQWRAMEAEEASRNQRLSEEVQRVQQSQRASGEAEEGSSNLPAPPGPSAFQRSRPRHQARRPAENQPPLFDQDDEGRT